MPAPKKAPPVWLFDLDNTLHDASAHIFPHINRAMTDYLAAALGVSEEEAGRVRMEYWRRYGATLTGMMRHHGTDPRHFLWHTHQFPNLQSMLVFESGLAATLRRLPGRRIVFSNAPLHYAAAVLRQMRLQPCIDAVYAIEQLGFRPKPQLGGFRALLSRERLDPARCILVEDSIENLRTARRLGMKTVLIGRAAKVPAWIDLRLQSVLELPRHVERLQRT